MRIKNYVNCTILRRLNRFVVEVEFNGKIERAYINNTGRLEELIFGGNEGICLKKQGKIPYRLFAVRCDGGYALIDTRFQMQVFEENVQKIPWIGCKNFRRDVKVGNSRIDYLFQCDEDVFVELKSAALKSGRYAMYPDCPTQRGRKHIEEMLKLAEEGERAVIVFVAAVPDVDTFKPNRNADPELYELLVEADKKGVEIRAIHVEFEFGEAVVKNFNLDVEL